MRSKYLALLLGAAAVAPVYAHAGILLRQLEELERRL